ncbi:Transcription repressor OFP2 [Hibiscus syriacus]|uniref:Transcription repressor n=1 Tax=Hibiscus syriacus TaxID=106335 RepID=A0A6A3C0V1_HIBSY|nr:transcription repressor OFP1-like [Hibiscus syriacus]KAE8722603.1 Transcription repressor OFP2 [Hibiscus syriacus]
MGNYKFRLSDMIPNVWFNKLKDMGRSRRNHTSSSGGRCNDNTRRKQNPEQPHRFCPRKSYHFTRELIPGGDFETKSSKQLAGKINPRKSTSDDCSNLQKEFRSDCILTTEFSCKLVSSEADELKLELPPIKCHRSSAKVKETIKKNNSGVKKFTVNSPGVKLRVNSPRIVSRRIHGRRRAASSSSSSSSLSGSFAVVKSSSDPQKDFRESMVEMIMENNIRTSKDLEDLLACYLSLNSNEYHDVIVKVFKQIWFDFCDVRMT